MRTQTARRNDFDFNLTIARAAGSDAANRQMRAEGRSVWNEDDYNLAARTMNALIDSVLPANA